MLIKTISFLLVIHYLLIPYLFSNIDFNYTGLTLSLVFFSIVIFSDVKKIFFKIRTYYGIKITKKKKLDKKFKNQGGEIGYKSINEEHIAIIWVSESKNNYPSIEKEGILKLINYYKNINTKYKLYFCYLADDFVRIVKSEDVVGIHIFGHGRIDSLYFEDGLVQYREFKGIIPKKFIAQWHCNHGEGKSLGEYIGLKYFSPYGYRTRFKNLKDIDRLIKDELDWEKNNF